jgi:hypothetical protein
MAVVNNSKFSPEMEIHLSITGLPDGIFSNQKIPISVNFGGP